MTNSQKKLAGIADGCAKKLISARLDKEFFLLPFKHAIIDDFFPLSLAEMCLSKFPLVNDACWEYTCSPDVEVKYRTHWKSEFDIPDGIIDAIRILNSGPLLLAMAELMQIKKLIPDPYYTGGGLNLSLRGGLLDVHVDGNYHDATGLNRRLNALVYLNPKWQPSWGGEFGVYNETGSICVKKIAPLHNRLIVFESHDKSFHGLPEPINFPENEPRRSILLYYYTKEARPHDQIVIREPHSALWKKRNLLDKNGNKTRSYT